MTDGGIWQPRDLPVLPPLADGVDEEVVIDEIVVEDAVVVEEVVVIEEIVVAEVVDDAVVVEEVVIEEIVVHEAIVDEAVLGDEAVVEVAVEEIDLTVGPSVDAGDAFDDEVVDEVELAEEPDAPSPAAHLERAPGLPDVPDAAPAGEVVPAVAPPEPAITPDALELELRAVDAALARLDRGDYGRCAVCNLVLDDAVMAADPTVAVCPAHVGLRPALAS